MMLKKVVYLSAFTVFGVLLTTIFHAIIEMLVIRFLLADFARYNLGLSWSQWVAVHHAGSLLLLAIGIVFGFWQGTFWWRVLYVEKRYRRVG